MFFFRKSEYPDKWNKDIVLLPHDRILQHTLIPLVPAWIKPNHITVARIFLIPAVLFALDRGIYAWGIPLFLFIALTDAFDGSLARVRRQISEWGILYDPVADKLFIGSVLFLIVLQHINFYLGMTLLFVEAAIIVLGWHRSRHGSIEPANVWGKIKMVTEVAAIMLLLIALWLKIDMLTDVSMSTLAMAVVFAVVSVLTRIK
jgi:CDP-diacylglycerol---glycerol-3-phosphate 3-phosphatidyltransferase